LLHEVVVDSCSLTTGQAKIEIRLTKAARNEKWVSLEAEETLSSGVFTLKYPSSARKPVDNAQVEKALAEEVEVAPQGEAAINSLFQKIYSDASEDTRRAMMKSFVESKGTVLSTNWEEVGSKKIDPVPPKTA